jgi:hypothetical protein
MLIRKDLQTQKSKVAELLPALQQFRKGLLRIVF